ncbi:hypothetical protein C7444_101369 [Sphaerotilus hippei]|uniref:Uncharacterized protein n=2 Tax=Sphaerotilus hippei TaxID=744406 RepID=A0A318HE26_9BURK|nr:hypothetical protein C7444_101369 [Sphaerotilus hippei]
MSGRPAMNPDARPPAVVRPPLAERQQALIARSALLRDELAGQTSRWCEQGLQRHRPALVWGLRALRWGQASREFWHQRVRADTPAAQGARAALVAVTTTALTWLWRRRRHRAHAAASAGAPMPASHPALSRVSSLLRWSRRALVAWRLWRQVSARDSTRG